LLNNFLLKKQTKELPMDWQSQLINVYLTTTNFFSQLSPHTFLKISPNSNPLLTDEETITIYIFGVLKELKNVKTIYKFTKDFLNEWFPHLPSYYPNRFFANYSYKRLV
jgi:hypothetical protein